jgi:hypothetical protein
MKALLITLLLLTACASQPVQPIAKYKINLNPNVVSCTDYYDHYECTLTNGETYYMMKTDILTKMHYDKSVWKEQPINNTENRTK